MKEENAVSKFKAISDQYEKKQNEPFIRKYVKPDTLCPMCGTKLVVSPEVGPYCPGKKCDVLDDLEKYWEKGIYWKEKLL